MPDPLDTFRHALGVAPPAAAFDIFRELVRRSPRTLVGEAWLREAWLAFTPGADPVSLRAAMAEARADPGAAQLLFARVAFASGFAETGLAACREAMAAAPEAAAPIFLLCAMRLKQRHPEAQRLLQRCLDAFPQPSDGWRDLGEVLLALGKPDAALVCLGRAKRDVASLIRLGRLAKELGRLDEARAAFEEAARGNPNVPLAWFLAGTCAQDQRDPAAAIHAYRTALTLAPQLAEAAVNLGTVLQETGDLAGARAAYAQAVSSRPDAFGRVAQALATSPTGELWLDLEALRGSLAS